IILNKFGIKNIPDSSGGGRDKAVFQLISQLFSENNIKGRNVNICAKGQFVFVRFVKLLQIKEGKLKQTMKFEAQNQIPFPLNEVAWDWALLDKNKAAKRAVIVAIKKNLVEEMVSRLKNIKLSAVSIDVSPMSLYNCMDFNEDYDEGRHGIILDIGAKATDLVIFNKGNIWIRSFPIAGERIAEVKEQGVEELISEVERSIEYYFMQGGEESQGQKLDKVILSGGGSMIENVQSRLAVKFNTEPKIIDPFRKLKISKDVLSNIDMDKDKARNQFAVAVGLALRGISEVKIEVDFLREIRSERYNSQQKSLYTRLSAVLVLLIVLSASIFMKQSYSIKRLKLDKIEEMLDIYKIYEPKIKEIKYTEDILKEKVNVLYQLAGSRAIWLDCFKIISEILPKEVWITDVSGIVSLEKSGLARLDLAGKALSYQSVNNFVSALKSSPTFKDVKPISSSIETDENTREEIVRFSITMDVVGSE
ncbi:MAG: pilus assembly protein PilM, partial [Candidatus Omnitrophica bacterium]|nr:pilus assembly protein PilM [Candidatus Omnitrophota bacterium]